MVLQALQGLSHFILKQSCKDMCYFYQMRKLRFKSVKRVKKVPSAVWLGSEESWAAGR